MLRSLLRFAKGGGKTFLKEEGKKMRGYPLQKRVRGKLLEVRATTDGFSEKKNRSNEGGEADLT